MNVSQLRQKILDFAGRDDNIRLVAETGAFAREFPPADELSDLDIELCTRNPQLLLNSRQWIEGVGPIVICLELANDGYNPTRLVIFEGGAKVDFSIYDVQLLESGFRSEAQRRGCIVHLDKDGLTQNWGALEPPRVEKPDAKVWRGLIDDFWLDNYNLAKYTARDDLWSAKFLDSEIKSYVLTMLGWHAHAIRGAGVWHLGHHLKSWTDAVTYAEIEKLFARFDGADTRRAMWATCDFFGRLGREVGEIWNLEYPHKTENSVRALMARMENFNPQSRLQH